MYDVAISFLARDECHAAALSDLIGDGLSVFFFPRKQEELAGTNGLESMRQAFLTARVVVVLYRHPWGDTPWTRVEQEAITDRFLKQGWAWLLFVQLDEQDTLPKWLPDTHIRFALARYGVEQLAGAVKMRVQEQGGRVRPPSALAHAQRIKRDADLIQDTQTWFRDRRWIQEQLHPQIELLVARLNGLTEQIASQLQLGVVARSAGRRCILRDERVSMNVGWRQKYINSALEDAELLAVEYNGPIFLPGEGKWMMFEPKELRRMKFAPGLSLARELQWAEAGFRAAPLSTEDLAHRIVSLFLDLVDRANKGQVALGWT